MEQREYWNNVSAKKEFTTPFQMEKFSDSYRLIFERSEFKMISNYETRRRQFLCMLRQIERNRIIL